MVESLKKFEKGSFEKLPEDFWFKIAKELYEKSGKIPDPLQIKAHAIIEALKIPFGEYSPIEINKEGGRINLEKDKTIGEFLINHPGVWIEKNVFSLDPRDIYPDGLPKEVEKLLDPLTREIFEIEWQHQKWIKDNFGETEDENKVDCPIHYFRLPGGIDLILKGYIHQREWQKIHGKFLKKINKNAKVVCIEGQLDYPYGKSIPYYYELKGRNGVYDALIKETIEEGFDGFFTEVDARDVSKIAMDNILIITRKKIEVVFPFLPEDFFKNYYKYLITQQPSLKEEIKNYYELKKYLKLLSTTEEGIVSRREKILKNYKIYFSFPYITKEGRTSYLPTYLELGQTLFSDALAAIRLHLIGKLMVDGYIERGPIIDYQGVGHISSKTFFLKYPGYAMLVVLRTINELWAGKVENLEQIYKVFENPDWSETLKEIVRLIFYKPEKGQLKKVEPDILKIYNLDPQKIIPSDKDIEKIQERLKRR